MTLCTFLVYSYLMAMGIILAQVSAGDRLRRNTCTFIFSGYPALEEAYRTAELLFPHLPLSASEQADDNIPQLVGEVVANTNRPKGHA